MRPDNTPEACRRWLNLIGFFARTSAAEMPQVDFSFYSLLAFDEAFRVALPGEVAVRTACMWMIWDATRLWKHVEKGTKIGDWPIMTRKMWYSWELGLERVREWAGRELRGPVDEALAAQRSAERGKSLI